MPYRRVVVGTDGSDPATRAVSHAGWVAEALGAELVVTHAYSEAEDEPLGPRRLGRSILRDACGLVSTAGPSAELRRGSAADALADVARAEDASLIVVGNRGLGRRRVLIGNVPARVAHRTPCDVLIAHTTGAVPQQGYEKALIATDGSPTATRAAQRGSVLASRLGLEAILFHAGDARRGADVLTRTAADVDGEVAGFLTEEGEAAEAILQAAARENCGLIVIGNKGMIGARRFLASVPSRVARRAPCHVLLVKTT